MKHAQRTEKYIRLIFNSYISDDDFFQKSMRIIDKLVFFWRFSRPRGGAHYVTLNTVQADAFNKLKPTIQGKVNKCMVTAKYYSLYLTTIGKH